MLPPLARDLQFRPVTRWRKELPPTSRRHTRPDERREARLEQRTSGSFFFFLRSSSFSLTPTTSSLLFQPPSAIPEASRRRFQLRRLRWPLAQLQQQQLQRPTFFFLLKQPRLAPGSGRLERRRRERARRRRGGESSREGRARLARQGGRGEVPAPRLGPTSGLVSGVFASAQGRAGTFYGSERSF